MSNISVCIASYNGEKYIREQIESIIPQLKETDEIIVSDDYSSDNTMSILESFNDHRIKIFKNTLSKGPVKNFENAISKASGDIIFLSDQDDVWKEIKVKTIVDFFEFNPTYTCVFSNAEIIDKTGQEIGQKFFSKEPKLVFINLLLKNEFLGCTMAFKKNVNILPFTKDLPMHDWFIGLKHLKKGKVGFIDKELISYRRHGQNVTTGKRSNFLQIVKWRLQILKALYFN